MNINNFIQYEEGCPCGDPNGIVAIDHDNEQILCYHNDKSGGGLVCLCPISLYMTQEEIVSWKDRKIEQLYNDDEFIGVTALSNAVKHVLWPKDNSEEKE